MKKINIADLLKDCPKGTKLYSPLFGEVEFLCVKDTGYAIMIEVLTYQVESFYEDGTYNKYYTDSECLLFPSKTQRDWSKFQRPFSEQDNWELIPNKFDITTLKPFDGVLVRDDNNEKWCINFFGYCDKIDNQYYCIGNTDIGWNECIPYEGNEHLLGTTNDCDEYFKTWE